MDRLPDWHSRIFALIADYQSLPFQWGQNDCAIWAGRVIEAVTGEDFYSAFVGKYSTKIGGFRVFKKATGHKSHIHYIQANFTAVQPSFAQVGDLGLVATDDGQAVALIAGEFLIAVGEHGLERLPLTDLISAFRIGV